MTVVAVPVPDWDYEALRREALSLIPAYAPEWTDHNPSDPGITLVELLAYFTDILLYRAQRVTPDARIHLLSLLGGGDAIAGLIGGPASDVDKALRARIAALSNTQCLVTARDFEQRAERIAEEMAGAGTAYRARCLPAVDAAERLGGEQNPADVAVILAAEARDQRRGLGALGKKVAAALAPDSPLTTHVSVIPASYLQVEISACIAPRPGASLAEAGREVSDIVARHYSPWFSSAPFGRTLHLSRVAAVIEAADSVDYVASLRVECIGLSEDGHETISPVGIRVGEYARPDRDAFLGGAASHARRRLRTDPSGEVAAIMAAPWEVLDVKLPAGAITLAPADGWG